MLKKEVQYILMDGIMAKYPKCTTKYLYLFKTERYGMRAHASWGSQDDAMLVFLNQDAYDKYCRGMRIF